MKTILRDKLFLELSLEAADTHMALNDVERFVENRAQLANALVTKLNTMDKVSEPLEERRVGGGINVSEGEKLAAELEILFNNLLKKAPR